MISRWMRRGVLLASGVAALSGIFFTFLKSGDHVITSKVTYIAVYRLLTEHLKNKYGIEATLVDTSDPEAVRAAIRPNTKLPLIIGAEKNKYRRCKKHWEISRKA